MKAASASLGAVLVVFVGCAGGSEPSGQGALASSLSPTSDEAITRLSPAEYANAVSELFGIAPNEQPIAAGTAGTASTLSGDTMSADDTALADYHSALAIAKMATSASHMATLLRTSNCQAPAANSGITGTACAAAFIDATASLAFRNNGPVDGPTRAGLNGLYNEVAVNQGAGFSGGIAAVVEEILQSPYFLYRGWAG